MEILEHKLTIDDLIVEYMIYKVKNGYEPSFTTNEFMKFLEFFEDEMEVSDVIYDNEELFKRFFERKNNDSWWIKENLISDKKIAQPHMEMIYSEKYSDYLIKANYKLSEFDTSIINTYFMDVDQVFRIRTLISAWMTNYSKRKIKEQEIDNNTLLVAKSVAAEIIGNIWGSYINEKIENNEWPIQCRDINKYLFEIDLAEIIGLDSIKNDLIELYTILSKRIAYLYFQDKNLKISSYSSGYLARANYDLIIEGYEKIINIAFGRYKKSLDLDFTKFKFSQSHEEEKISDDNKIKKLVINLDNNSRKN